MINVQYVDDELDKEFINEILEIDASVYPKHLQGTFEEVYGRFCANRDMFVLLYDEKKLIGYLCLFPIKDTMYAQITGENKLFDSDIPGEMLEQYRPHNVYKLYLISMVIIPEYQKKGLSKHLIKGFYHFILEKKKKNILFSVILSSAVTNDGKLMLERMGFKEKKKLPGGYSLNELIINDAFYEIAERNSK
jgi:GNAT superfamily N-acetyltransferase